MNSPSIPQDVILQPRIVTREQWLTERKRLLAKEKALAHQRDHLSAERRQLPWVEVEKVYWFDGPGGRASLADLFDGRSQLIVKGRNETGPRHDLTDWVRHHDRYDQGGAV